MEDRIWGNADNKVIYNVSMIPYEIIFPPIGTLNPKVELISKLSPFQSALELETTIALPLFSYNDPQSKALL